MKWLQISLIMFLYCYVTCLEDSVFVPRYLSQKSDNIKDSMVGQFKAHRKVKFEMLCSANLTQNGTRGLIFTLFDNVYVTVDNTVYEVSICEDQWKKIFATKHELLAVKAVEHKNLGFVVFATKDGALHVYQVSKERKKYYWMHDIINPIVDLELFRQNEELYLGVTNSNQLNIYKLVGTYFSMIDTIPVRAGYTYSFSNKGNQIIVAGDSRLTGLYTFTAEKLKKIHEFEAAQFKEVLSYSHKNATFLVFFHKKNYATRYLWTGEELIFQNEFRTSTRIDGEKRVFYYNNFPYLIASKNNIVSVFLLEKVPFQKVAVSQSAAIAKFLDHKILMNSDNNPTLLMIGKNSKYIFATKTSLFIQNPATEKITLREKTTLNSCFLTLEKNIYNLRSQLKKLSSKRLTREANPWLEYEQLQQKINSALFVQRNHINNSGILIVNETTTLTNFIQCPKITIQNLNLDKLNHRKWNPDKWLSYKKNQTINGSLKTRALEAEKLKTNPQDQTFADLLLKSGDQHISGNVTAQNLNSISTLTDTINNIPFQHIYLQSNPVVIEGLKKFKNFNVRNIKTSNINEANASETVSFLKNKNLAQYVLSPNLLIDDLWVENINGVNMDRFNKSVFRLDSRGVLQGNFTFSQISAGNIKYRTLSGHRDFLTGSGNQTIESSIKIKKIIATNIDAGKINGIDFKKSVATFGSIVKSPINFYNMIANHLQIENETKLETLRTSTHVIGTNSSDLQQRYNGKIKITGNVYIKNLNIQPQAKLLLSGEEFDTDLQKYWTRSTEQKIDTQFEASNGMSAPHLFTNFINDVNVADYMINTNKEQKPAKFYFENVKVKGNVVLNKKYQHLPNIPKIQNNSLLTNGDAFIKGRKTFQRVLKIDNLRVAELRNKIGNKYLDPGMAEVVMDPKFAKNLKIRGNMNCKLLQIEKMNEIDLKELLEKTVYVDQLNHSPEINFENVEAKNLTVTVYNGELMNDIIMKVEQLKNISKISNVIAKQNVEIEKIQNLRKINDFQISDIDFGKMDTTSTPIMLENTRFVKNVNISNLVAITINNVDFQNLSQRVLFKNWSQPIFKHATFGRIKSRNFFATTINDRNVEHIIDISSNISQEISTNFLKFNNNIKVRDLNVNCSCDIKEAFENLKNPPSQFWRNVVILGNATFWDREASVVKILNDVVTSEGNNEITGKITVNNHISVNNMYTLGPLNGIILNDIIEDAFLNNQNKTQVIRGQKTFSVLAANDLVSKNFLNVSKINDIDILDLKNKVLFKNSNLNTPIKGKKTFFAGLQTKNIQTAGIGTVKAEDLVTYDDDRSIPDAVFEYISISKNLDIKTINKMPFDQFLNNRMLKNAPNQVLTRKYFFHNLKIFGNATMNRLNNISINSIVFDKDLQTIASYKNFKNDMTIVGNMSVDIINGLNLSTVYSKALTLDQPNVFNKSVQIYGPIDLTGCVSIETNKINNIPTDHIFEINIKQTIKSEADTIVEIKQQLSEFIRIYLNATRMPNQLMYIEKTEDLQLSFPNISNARILETPNAVLLHIENEDDGRLCGLPESCACPVQQTVQISSERSINMFFNKGVQRIYSYYNDKMMIHLICNSVSTDSYCRTNNTRLAKEVSSLTWSIYPTKNTPGGFFVHPTFLKGYISNVEFFTINGKTYIIIGFAYDPVLNTHNVNCVVLGFNENENEFEEVDKIPTEGMKILSVFYTSKGIILIMSKSSPSLNGTQTKILRFNDSSEKFEVLRILPTIGSTYAIGVVLHKDSFIILANQENNLHILRYRREYDNYHFFQIIRLNYPILSLSTFYTGAFGISDAYFAVVMAYNKYRIYSFQYLGGWKLTARGSLDGAKSLLPFSLNKKVYLFVPATKSSSILSLVQHDLN